MTSEKYDRDIPLDENEMENVELHRAESMVNDQTEITDTVKDGKTQDSENETFQTVGRTFRSLLSEILKMKIEVIMFLYMFSYVMRSVSSTSMIMDKVCLVHLNYPEDICRNLSAYNTTKLEVEKLANNYHLGHTLIQLMPSAFLALFIGSWSDKYSRKIPIMASLLGIILDGFGSTICAYYLHSRVEYYFIPAIFTGISGGFIGVLTVLYSYASDVSTPSNRTMKYALMEMAFLLAMPLGSLAGGYIFKYAGYVAVFLTSTCSHIIGLFWVALFLEETRGLDCKESVQEKFHNFWNTDSVVDSFKATTKKRPNRGREQIWWLIVGMSVSVFNLASTGTIAYIYIHHRYDWENTTYSTVSSIFMILSIILMLIIVPVSKKKNIGDPILGTAGSVSLLLKNVVIGLASTPWIYFAGNLAGLISGLGTLAGRARISKVTSKEDLGKVFSFLTTAESILPIAGTAIVSQVLNASLERFPGLIYEVMGLLIVVPIGIFIWLSRLPAMNYEEMNNASHEEEVIEKIPEKTLYKEPHPKNKASVTKGDKY